MVVEAVEVTGAEEVAVAVVTAVAGEITEAEAAGTFAGEVVVVAVMVVVVVVVEEEEVMVGDTKEIETEFSSSIL